MAGDNAFKGDMQSGANCARGLRLEDRVTREEAEQAHCEQRWDAQSIWNHAMDLRMTRHEIKVAVYAGIGAALGGGLPQVVKYLTALVGG